MGINIRKLFNKKYLSKIFDSFKKRGWKNSFRYITYRLSTVSFILKIRNYFLDKKLNRIIQENTGKEIIMSLSFVDWKVPLFQRPQHIALQLAKQGYLYFYHTKNVYDFIDGYKKIGKNLYLTNRFEEVYKKLNGKKKIIHLSNNMYEEDDKIIENAIENGDKILYEYWDEINPELSGRAIPEFVFNRHEKLLRDEENCFVVATADKLYKDVSKYRNKNYSLITNGVVYEHFQNVEKIFPSEIQEVVGEGKKIIGYYGAMASWFDYKLIKDVAISRKDWNIVLIGWDYDGSLKKSGLLNIENVKVIPPVEYTKLPLFAQWFDVCIIPFKINEITKSTSPVKLFEYMALGKPIVTTPIPECKKYESVLIAENESDDFIKKIEIALNKKDDAKYLTILEKEALSNTWEQKAKDIINLLSAVK